jgi:diguanylate cyclase (GGDEF)-like protein
MAPFGDELLRQMANRMTDIAPKKNAAYLARWGADEFILVLKGIDKNTVKEHTLNLQMQLQEPMIIFNQKVSLTFSLGCSFYPEDAQVPSDCIRFSELALHEAKSEGGRTIVYYHNDLSAKALNRFELENGLKWLSLIMNYLLS